MIDTIEEPKEDQKVQSKVSANPIDSYYANMTESSEEESPYIFDSVLKPYNPDDLWQKQNAFTIYESMIKDEQVNTALQLKKDLVLGSGWSIQYEMDDEEGKELRKEIQDFIEYVLIEELEEKFDDALEEILTAYDFGFSLTEKIFKKNEDGKIVLSHLKTRHPDSWLIHTDTKGNITKYEQRTNTGSIAVDKKSLIHLINKPKYSNPYGTSDLRTAHAGWFTKQQILRYYGIYLEKSASPIPYAKYAPGTSTEAQDDLFQSLKSFQQKTALVYPNIFEVDFLENTGKSADTYSTAIGLMNLFIGRALFVPDLIGLTGDKTNGGSYSLGKDQMAIFFKHINRRRETLQQLINKEIIELLVVNNFGLEAPQPKLKFKPLDDGSAIESAKLWLDAVKGKTYKPTEEEINYFRKLVKFPIGPVEFQEPVAQPPPFGIQPGQPPIEKADEDPLKEDNKDDKEPGLINPIDIGKMKGKGKQDFAFKVPANYGEYYKKVDFAAIKSQLDNNETVIKNELQPVIKKIYADLFDQIEKKNIVQNGKIERMDSLKLKYLREVKQILKDNLKNLYVDGKASGQSELLKGNYAKVKPSDKFMEIIDQELYNYVGDWEYKALSSAKTELIAAVKDGRPLSSVLSILDSDGKKLSESSLDRYARTKTTEVYNKGRLEFFEESGVVAAYQYSAIMDDRTSDICAGLDGKVFTAGSQPIPPMHFNCRSLLIPITKYEDFKIDTKVGSVPIDKFIDDNLGKGFPVQ